MGDHAKAHLLAPLAHHKLGRLGQTLVVPVAILLGAGRLPAALLALQVLQVAYGHLDDFRLFHPSPTFAHVLLRNESRKIGQAGVHPISAPFLNDPVRQWILLRMEKWNTIDSMVSVVVLIWFDMILDGCFLLLFA